MKKVYLSKNARIDLIEIKDYTTYRWGKEKAETYIRSIYLVSDKIAQKELPGKDREEIAPETKSYHVGRHMLFYRETSDGIVIARVLHDSMDFKRHF